MTDSVKSATSQINNFFKSNPTLNVCYFVDLQKHPGFMICIQRDKLLSKSEKLPNTGSDIRIHPVSKISLDDEVFKQCKVLAAKADVAILTASQVMQCLGGRSYEVARLLQYIDLFEESDIHELDRKHEKIFASVIQAYIQFMERHLLQIFERLNFSLKMSFYQEKHYLTQSEDKQRVVDDLWSYSTNSSDDKETIISKLNSAKQACKDLLSSSDALKILGCMRKIERLIPAGDAVFWDKPYTHELFAQVDAFNRHYRLGVNPFMNFAQDVMQNNLPLPEEQIIRVGTVEEKRLIAQLREKCLIYKKYLSVGLVAEDTGELESGSPWVLNEATHQLEIEDEDLEILDAMRLKIEKYNAVQRLLRILDRKNTHADEKIVQFRNEFNESRQTLARHRDAAWINWTKSIVLLLTSFILGAGLLYSYEKTGSCNFFKAKGALVSDQLDHILGGYEGMHEGVSSKI